MISLLKNRVVS